LPIALLVFCSAWLSPDQLPAVTPLEHLSFAMRFNRHYATKATLRQATRQAPKKQIVWSQRARRTQLGTRNVEAPFSPPEDWHEPRANRAGYRIVVQDPGAGYSHIVTPEQIRERLNRVPQEFLRDLEVVQLSRMTRKKSSFPCYGMQWSSTLYLYPLEDSLEEIFYRPPRPEVVNEARMYGGCWDEPALGVWRLKWSRAAIEDFYLNNILIHELGHLVDDRNSSYTDRERYAEWFAIHYGYKTSGGRSVRRPQVRRRHHGK
jgi:hypothetical protein